MNHYAIFDVVAALVGTMALIGSVYVSALAIIGFFSKHEHSSTLVAGAKTGFLILVPAHDEERGIGPTLRTLQTQNYPQDLRRVVVIADNCTDRTAVVSRQIGVECLERSDTSAPGKGQALRWALDRLSSDKWDAVAFVDADTQVDRGFLIAMDRALQHGSRAIQGSYEFDLPDHSYLSLLTFGSKRAENNLFWRPRERFGYMAFIGGNGFCLKREVLRAVPWAAYSIVEDVEYTMELALRGIRVQFLESAKVVSRSTRRSAEAAPQRLRWASGTLQVMSTYIPKLLVAGIRKRSFRLVEVAVALGLTSRLLLIYLVFIASALSLFLASGGPAMYVRIEVAATCIALCVYAGLVLSQIPDIDGSRFRALLNLPVYICWLLLVQAAAALGIRHKAWVRTNR